MYVGETKYKWGYKYQEEYRKIALRFLKETGLINYWRKYISENGYVSKCDGCVERLTASNWYEVEYIDRVFGRTSITKFLKKDCGFEIKYYSISDLFRTYLRKNHTDEYTCICGRYVAPWILEAIKKAGTFKIIEFQKYINK